MDLTPSIKDYAVDKVLSLSKFLPEATLTEIELERTTRHHQKGQVWRAEANLHATERLVRAEAYGEDIYGAIDKLKHELKRTLVSFKEKRTAVRRRSRKKP